MERARVSTAWAERMSQLVARLMRTISRHWLVVANFMLLLNVGLPTLAPVLMFTGHEKLGRLIYMLFSPLCHQLPERSFFLFGPQWTYTRPELIALVGEGLPLRFIGNAVVGYKIAVCQRCVAIYGSWLLWGLLFGLFRSHIRPLSLRGFAFLLAPLAVDGIGQLISLWTSTWWSRLLTGTLFGLAVVWLTYPYIEMGMRTMHKEACDMLANPPT